MSSPIHNHEHSEEEWGARLKASAEADRAARSQYRKALADYRNVLAGSTSERDAADKSRLALDEAQRNEKVELRVLEAKGKLEALGVPRVFGKGPRVAPAASSRKAKDMRVQRRSGSTETPMERGARRRGILDPALAGKGWSVYRWEKVASVSSKVGQRYYDGVSGRLSADSRQKLSNALGIDLPD